MAVEIYEKGEIELTAAVVEILPVENGYIPSWEFFFPERDSLSVVEIYALLDGLAQAYQDLDKIITTLLQDDDANGEI